MSRPDVSAVHQALVQQGFVQVNTTSSRKVRYAGVLRCSGVDVPVHLDITDFDFVELPRITLLKRPATLPAVCSHLGRDNVLCYLSARVAHIDVHRAPGQILDCITKAEDVLSRLLRGDPLIETRDEFAAYWAGELPALIDAPDNRKFATAWCIEFEDGRKHWIIGTDLAVVKEKYERAGGRIVVQGAPVAILESNVPPSVTETEWPPKQLRDVVAWLSKGDPETLSALKRALKDLHRMRDERAMFVVKNKWAWYGFSVKFDRAMRSKHRSVQDWIQHVLYKKGSEATLTRLLPVRIDRTYLVSRNLSTEKSLEQKRIVLAGCGTIGGYLAELLARAGAGGGAGRLILVDPDVLAPGNLGRHVLGISDLFRNKAEAVRDWISARFPDANVVAMNKDIRNVTLKNADLLIDATGDEALSNSLNLRYLRGELPPILYSWIKGPGTAAQALLVDSSAHGCFRCLKTVDGQDRYSPLLEPVEAAVMGHGCDDYYVPFSAAASMQAAALTGQLVLDWVNGRATPHLRTRAISYQNLRELKDKDLTRTPSCPACG